MLPLLSICQQACYETGLIPPSTIVSNTDPAAILLKIFANDALSDVSTEGEWPQLITTGSITLVASQVAYSMPADWYRTVPDTAWNEDELYPVYGPIGHEEWMARQYGQTASPIRDRYMMRGLGPKFEIQPTPSGSVNDSGTVASATSTTLTDSTKTWTTNQWDGQTVMITAGPGFDQVREITSNTATVLTVDPAWTTNPTAASSYEIADGDVHKKLFFRYMTNNFASTVANAFESTFSADTSMPVLDDDLVRKDIVWRLREKNSMDYSRHKADAERSRAVRLAEYIGTGRLNLLQHTEKQKFVGIDNIPDRVTGV